MKTRQGTTGAAPVVRKLSDLSIIGLIVATKDDGLAIAEHLRRLDIEVHLTPSYAAMALRLFDNQKCCGNEPPRDANNDGQTDAEILFVLDLRLSCGAAEVDRRLGDYDAVLHAHLMSGSPWPKTLCLVDASQTHPAWLQARPHLRATLLADEVETVVGDPGQLDWDEKFVAVVSRCFCS